MVGDKNQGVGKGWYRQSNHVRLGAISPNSDEKAVTKHRHLAGAVRNRSEA